MTSINKPEIDGKYDDFQLKQMQDMCIVIDKNDNVLGGREKLDCHLMENINKGLIHRGLSVLLFNTKNEYLITHRSDEKITFPGHFSNACCSHPLYKRDELEETDGIGSKRAALRRLKFELGIDETQISMEDLVFVRRVYYKATSDQIWGELEVAHIFVVRKDIKLYPDPKEVQAHRYVTKDEYKKCIASKDMKFTPWTYMFTKSFIYELWDNIENVKTVAQTKHITNLSLELPHGFNNN